MRLLETGKRKRMLDYVRKHTAPYYTQAEAEKEINSMLMNYGPECKIQFYNDAAKIKNSYLVRSELIRHMVCAVIANTGLTARSFENLSAEWLLHNICYHLHIKRSSAVDADLDYTRDRRFAVRILTKIMDIFDIE